MGGGTGPRGPKRKGVGGVTLEGEPTLDCPESGVVIATPDSGASPGLTGILAVRGPGLCLIDESGAVAAVATPSPEEALLRRCIGDGTSYIGTLEETSGGWSIRYREG
jgi:hypothetical protein